MRDVEEDLARVPMRDEGLHTALERPDAVGEKLVEAAGGGEASNPRRPVPPYVPIGELARAPWIRHVHDANVPLPRARERVRGGNEGKDAPARPLDDRELVDAVRPAPGRKPP
jgi:hypothetical protein